MESFKIFIKIIIFSVENRWKIGANSTSQLSAQIKVDMWRNICAQFHSYVIPAVSVILFLCLAFEQSQLSDLKQKLAEERVKNLKFRQISKDCDNEQFRLRRESILKDNKTAEIWSKLGKTENEADNCKKELIEKESELKEKDEVIWKNKDVRKQCAKDLTDLRFWSLCFNLCKINAIMEYWEINLPCPLELHPLIILLHRALILFSKASEVSLSY